ncbi:hypothetical protein F4777DRAFT_547510 [Nemania sp. FL0916]|nr:hypothetical protein F4777DRAFT_547510 [Nemania sp. FL0916]
MLIYDQLPSATGGLFLIHDAPVHDERESESASAEWKGKEKAVNPDDEGVAIEIPSEQLTVDWTKYEPPDELRLTGDIESETIIQLINDSIETVKTRIREEDEQKEAAKQRQADRERQRNEKGKEPETNDDGGLHENPAQVDEVPAETNEAHPSPNPDQNPPRPDSTEEFAHDSTHRSKKRTLLNLFRKLNGDSEHGESSSAGAARHALLMHSSHVELTTHSGRRRFVRDLLKKGVGEDSSSSGQSIQGPQVECVSCLDDFDPKDTVRAPCHNYCNPCFQRLIESACKNEQHWPPKCCLNAIPHNTIIANVDEQQRQDYRARAREWNVPIAERIYCSEPNCSEFIRPEYIIAAQGVARCTAGHYTCIVCRNARHEGDGCPQDRDLQRTNALAEAEGWKRCYGCHAYVEHREACQHMTCRCGAEFCYVCGARWQTCRCTMNQLHAVKQAAETRRRERQQREAEEEAAVQEAIRLVEEFQREEDLKAELLRKEQARIAQEKRERALEEHIRREGERRQAVAIKYEALRATLASVHVLQRNAVSAHHERRHAQLQAKVETALERQREQHVAERAAAQARADARIAAREEVARDEYATRVLEERRIEATYQAKLSAFWSGRRDGALQAAQALRDLRLRMDNAFGVWQRWTDGELEAVRHAAREEQGIAEELLLEKERRLKARAGDVKAALKGKCEAERRWVEEVVMVRERALDEGEVEELESGEDIDAWFAEEPLEEVLELNVRAEMRLNADVNADVDVGVNGDASGSGSGRKEVVV